MSRGTKYRIPALPSVSVQELPISAIWITEFVRSCSPVYKFVSWESKIAHWVENICIFVPLLSLPRQSRLVSFLHKLTRCSSRVPLEHAGGTSSHVKCMHEVQQMRSERMPNPVGTIIQ